MRLEPGALARSELVLVRLLHDAVGVTIPEPDLGHAC